MNRPRHQPAPACDDGSRKLRAKIVNTTTASQRSANGAASCQPGATPQEHRPATGRGLKARTNPAGIGPGFQPWGLFVADTQGVALGWNKAGALPLALDAESAKVLVEIRRLL